MKIVVNNKTYTDSRWVSNIDNGESTLILKTDETISEIADTFDGNDTIAVYDDNDVEICEWHVHALLGIQESKETHTAEESREVNVILVASALTINAEQRLSGGIDENMEAILELAELIADMDDANIEIEKIKAELNGIPKNIVSLIGDLSTAFNGLADRVARLENANQ